MHQGKKKDLEFLQPFVFFQRMLKAGEKSSTALPNISLSWSAYGNYDVMSHSIEKALHTQKKKKLTT